MQLKFSSPGFAAEMDRREVEIDLAPGLEYEGRPTCPDCGNDQLFAVAPTTESMLVVGDDGTLRVFRREGAGLVWQGGGQMACLACGRHDDASLFWAMTERPEPACSR